MAYENYEGSCFLRFNGANNCWVIHILIMLNH